MKFFLTKDFWANWFKGWGYILILKPLAWFALGPYRESLYQKAAAEQIKALVDAAEKAQKEESKRRGH